MMTHGNDTAATPTDPALEARIITAFIGRCRRVCGRLAGCPKDYVIFELAQAIAAFEKEFGVRGHVGPGIIGGVTVSLGLPSNTIMFRTLGMDSWR